MKPNITEFLKKINKASDCDMLSECEDTIKYINDFASIHKMPYSSWPKILKIRYKSICNKRQSIYNNFYKHD